MTSSTARRVIGIGALVAVAGIIAFLWLSGVLAVVYRWGTNLINGLIAFFTSPWGMDQILAAAAPVVAIVIILMLIFAIVDDR